MSEKIVASSIWRHKASEFVRCFDSRSLLTATVWALPFSSVFLFTSCRENRWDPKAEAPLTAKIESEDFSVIKVDHPEQFPLATAIEYVSTHRVTVPGFVDPGVSQGLPGTSTTTELPPGSLAHVYRLANTVTGLPNLNRVWVTCEVPEGDLADVRLGADAEIRVSAYPRRAFTGRVGFIGPVLDQAYRIAKVRIEIRNPRQMRPGMLVTATFRGRKREMHAAIPATAIILFHDRTWIYAPAGDKIFRRTDVVAGNTLPGEMREIISGIKPGNRVIKNALALQKSADNR